VVEITVADAAGRVGKSKAALLRTIKSGTISAARGETTGAFGVDASDLHHGFPPIPDVADTRHAAADQASWGALRAQLEAVNARIEELHDSRRMREDTIADLQRQLTASLADRHATPPARRPWWPWRQLALTVALFTVPSLCVAAEGGLGTGNELLSDCSEPTGQYGYGLCLGYVLGAGSSSASGVHCPPKGSTRAQAIDAVVH
jgi:hypothetical protein